MNKELPCIDCITLSICKIKVNKLMDTFIEENIDEYIDHFGKNLDGLVPMYIDISWVIFKHTESCSLLKQKIDEITLQEQLKQRGIIGARVERDILSKKRDFINNVYNYLSICNGKGYVYNKN